LFYLAVCAGLLLRLLYGLVRALKIWNSAMPVATQVCPPFTRGISLRSSKAVSSPVTIGSAVVLPAEYVEWDVERLRIVLAHESSHIRQGDFYLQFLAAAYTAVFWFSPLGWWLKRKLSELGETISDRAGLDEAASSASYAQILLEFAALPRPTFIGVAMARRSNLSHRIERLLNESSFRQAFTGSRRMLLAVLLVPIMLFAATALVRVEAAGKAPQQAPQQAPEPSPSALSLTGQAHPDPAPASIEPSPQEPGMPPAPKSPAAPAPPIGPGSTVVPSGAQSWPSPPDPPSADDNPDVQRAVSSLNESLIRANAAVRNGYAYRYSANGDSWVLVTDASEQVRFSGDWHNSTRDMIDKVRSQGHQKFLLFTHDGKSYFIDDPAIVAQVEAADKPMESLGREQEELSKKQEELGKQQEELGRKQEMTKAPAPDLSKEMADLKATMAAAMAKVDAEKAAAISRQELADLQSRMGAIQARLGEIQARMSEGQSKLGALNGKLGEEQAKLGEEQGRLGAEQGRIAAEADRLVREIIGESLSSGKAHPVE
jgi:hypothetical protein